MRYTTEDLRRMPVENFQSMSPEMFHRIWENAEVSDKCLLKHPRRPSFVRDAVGPFLLGAAIYALLRWLL